MYIVTAISFLDTILLKIAPIFDKGVNTHDEGGDTLYIHTMCHPL